MASSIPVPPSTFSLLSSTFLPLRHPELVEGSASGKPPRQRHAPAHHAHLRRSLRARFHLARLCVASIRYWYPEIPISLIVDYELGDFDFRPLLRDWRVELFPTHVRRFGWGMSKLETLFLPQGDRFLVLDADIVLLGPVLDLLNQIPGDFVVDPLVKKGVELERAMFATGPLAAFDASFALPPTVFNSGQYVATGGLLDRRDFDPVLEWSEPRRLRHPEIFQCGEQGLFNYVLVKAEAAGRLTVGRQKFLRLRHDDNTAITETALAHRTSPPVLFHWAGYKAPTIPLMNRADILEFYARYERREISSRSRFIYWWRDQSADKWRAVWARLRYRARQWLAGTPLVYGGTAMDILPAALHGFYDLERLEETCWYWSQPESSITLPLRSGSYHVEIRTGSPHPMAGLAQSHFRLFLNDCEISPSRIHLMQGVAEFDLDPSDFHPQLAQVLRFSIDRLPTDAHDERTLGFPLASLRIFRRGRW